MGSIPKKSSTSSYWEEAVVMKRAIGAGYPEPKLFLGDIFISNCDSSVEIWRKIDYKMNIGDSIIVHGVVPITRFDGSFVNNPEGPWWCYIFKNLTRGGEEFEMQGAPAHTKVIQRSDITRLLYE
jgi:hypothetical protein